MHDFFVGRLSLSRPPHRLLEWGQSRGDGRGNDLTAIARAPTRQRSVLAHFHRITLTRACCRAQFYLIARKYNACSSRHRRVLSRPDPARAIHLAHEAKGENESESEGPAEGPCLHVPIVGKRDGEREGGDEREREERSPGPKAELKRASRRAKKDATGVTRTPRRKDEGASARSCSLRPRTA